MHLHILRDLFAPEKPQNITLDQIYKWPQAHFEFKPIVIIQRFMFHQRNQRCLATHCEFGEFLSQDLHNRFVCSFRDCDQNVSFVREETGVASSNRDGSRHGSCRGRHQRAAETDSTFGTSGSSGSYCLFWINSFWRTQEHEARSEMLSLRFYFASRERLQVCEE